MVKTEALYPKLAEIDWRRFNFPWRIINYPNIYHWGVDIIIYKYLKDCLPISLCKILIFDIGSNMHNKNLVISAIHKV